PQCETAGDPLLIPIRAFRKNWHLASPDRERGIQLLPGRRTHAGLQRRVVHAGGGNMRDEVPALVYLVAVIRPRLEIGEPHLAMVVPTPATTKCEVGLGLPAALEGSAR